MRPEVKALKQKSDADFQKHMARSIQRLEQPRAELAKALDADESQIIWVPRRHVEYLLTWFDYFDDEEDDEVDYERGGLKAAIGRRIDQLIECLDALSDDSDLKDDDSDCDDLREPTA